MNGYKAFYNGRTADVYAGTLVGAIDQARMIFNAPRSKQHMVSVVLCEKYGKPVEVSPASL